MSILTGLLICEGPLYFSCYNSIFHKWPISVIHKHISTYIGITKRRKLNLLCLGKQLSLIQLVD